MLPPLFHPNAPPASRSLGGDGNCWVRIHQWSSDILAPSVLLAPLLGQGADRQDWGRRADSVLSPRYSQPQLPLSSQHSSLSGTRGSGIHFNQIYPWQATVNLLLAWQQLLLVLMESP